MVLPDDQVTKLMNLLKIPAEKRNFEELQDQIQNLIEENNSFKRYYQSKNDNTLETILNNPGLQHLAENIIENLDYDDFERIGEINQSSKQILDYQMSKPLFLLKKFRGLSKENQKDWINVIESEKNSKKKKAISTYLLWNLKKEALPLDLPCYWNFQFRKKICAYMQWNLKKDLPCICKKEVFVDLPCYTSPAVQDLSLIHI